MIVIYFQFRQIYLGSESSQGSNSLIFLSYVFLITGRSLDPPSWRSLTSSQQSFQRLVLLFWALLI
ncbi:hypothetical protein H1P_610029 [Hyella patelloides LEGE 07179]|uniref:Uncharacterized protein n=1 Tax=Hyella patelloides LEGE 07179 TaxID=945734 RepID=A0A563W1A9_9CYAN|nr:hypothetical protein H1P_610029 [Hyella patelloides LEGE 07179]